MSDNKVYFNKRIDRRGTGACKWECVQEPIRSMGLIPYTIADMELEIAPMIKQALIAAASHGICGYTLVDDTYFDALSGYMLRRHGYHVKREQLSTTFGVVSALGIAIRAFTNEGDGIIIQTPVYPPFFSAVQDNKRKLLENKLIERDGHYEMDFDDLERIMRTNNPRLLILCSPHNPVGRVWTRDELTRVAMLCEKYDVLVVSDEIHSDIVQKDYSHIVFATLPKMEQRTITCTAMSKTFNLAGLMCSNIFIANEKLHARFEEQLATDGSDCIPYFARAAAITAFTECDEWIDALNDFIEENHRICRDFISDKLPTLKCNKAEGTYLVWIDFSALGMDDSELEAFLLNEAKLALSDGSHFGECGKRHIRMNIAVPRDELTAALTRLYSAINSRKEA